MTVLTYNEYLGQLHFWVTFFGVNITFFPMHFLGLAGMPRRISYYPDAFAGWNYISSVGSFITGFATLIFVVVVVEGFVSGRHEHIQIWRHPVRLTTIKDSSLSNLTLLLDAPYNYQITFQDPATETMEAIINFHYDLMFYLVFITVFILFFMIRILMIFRVGS